MSTQQSPRSSSRFGRQLGAALAAIALLAGAAVVHAQTKEAPSAMEKSEKKAEKAVSDSWITTKVKSEILANSVSKGFKVRVTTKSGIVHLKGELPTQDAIDLVKMIAEKVKGVNSVDVSGLSKVS